MSETESHERSHDDGQEEARDEMKRVEENPPENLEDWPGGKAKYMTMGGPESNSGYEDGPTSKLGPSDLRHHEDGSVTVGGEEVDNPDDYKGEPIPGGPTDPDAADDPSMTGEQDDQEGSGDRTD